MKSQLWVKDEAFILEECNLWSVLVKRSRQQDKESEDVWLLSRKDILMLLLFKGGNKDLD